MARKILLRILLVLGLIVIIYALVLGHSEAKKNTLKMMCISNLRYGTLYLSRYERLDPEYRLCKTPLPYFGNDDHTEEYWSWRVAFAPRYDKSVYRLNEPWNSEYNLPLVLEDKDAERAFACPAEYPKQTKASYVAVKGPGTYWTEMQKKTITGEEYVHGEMIVVIETLEPKNRWAEPGDDVSPEEVVRQFLSDPGLVKNSKGCGISRYSHFPKFFVRADGKIESFDVIENVGELRRRLVISELMNKSKDEHNP